MMNREEFHDSDKDTSEENPILQELRRHLTGAGPVRQPFDTRAATQDEALRHAQDGAQDGPWPQRFRRLAEAIAQVDDVPCEECEALLDVYVDAELANEDARRRYPRLWQHLQTCADCAAAHELLLETLTRERREAPSSPSTSSGRRDPAIQFLPPRLSFLEPPAPDTPWSVRIRSRLAGAPFGLTFTLTPAYVRALLSSARPVPARTRGINQPRPPLLLLADSVPLGDGQVVVEVVATPDDRNQDQLHLRATIAGTTTLPANLWAVLKWGDETRAGPVDEQSQADLGEMSLATLQAALEAEEPTCEIAFEERGGEGHAGARAD